MAARTRFALVALALYAVCAVWATWPAIRHIDDHYLARPAPGYGEAAAGDHLQLGWAFWLVGHQLGQGASPLADPYSFRPEAEAPPSLQGWLLGIPYWPLGASLGDVWAYDLIVLLTFVLAGAVACAWLRALGLSRPAALLGGVVFCLMPYRVGQSTGHLLGLISFLLPAVLLALERRRFALAAACLAAIPLSGQLHLALGAIPLALGYAWARTPRADWWKAGAGALAALVAGLLVDRWAVAGSIGTGRSFSQVARYSAELADFVTRGVGSGIEELVFVGWLTPLVAVGGLIALRSRPGLAVLLGLAALMPCLLALGANLPGYETLWRRLPGLDATRVPERFMPIACLALAALVGCAFEQVTVCYKRISPAARWRLAGAAIAVLAADLRVPVFGAVAADTPSAAYAAIRGHGRLLELPVFRPDVHYGSVYLGYARQSPQRAAAGVLDDRAQAGRRPRPGAPATLLRSRDDPARAGDPVRRRPPGALRAERLLRARVRRPGRARTRRRADGGGSPGTGRSRSSPGERRAAVAALPPPYRLTRRRIRVVTLGPAYRPPSIRASVSSISPCEHPARTSRSTAARRWSSSCESSLRSMSQLLPVEPRTTGGIAVLVAARADRTSGRHPSTTAPR